MCTLTWRTDDLGTRLFFNRDEQRTRLPALPPSVHVRNGVQWLAAVDANAGGTWLTVNDQGVAVAILNYYEADRKNSDDVKQHRSRGQLVMDLADVRSPAEILDRLSRETLECYRPFILVGLDEKGHAGECRWDGASLQAVPLSRRDLPVSTSSFKTTDVLAARRHRYAQIVGDAPNSDEKFISYHKSRDPLGGPFSVTMTRRDAMTVSFSRVEIGIHEVRYRYEPRVTEGDDPEYEHGVEAVLDRS